MEKRMKRVYIAGPFRAKTNLEMQRNIDRAAAIAHAVWAMGNAAVLCPHLNTPLAFQGSLPDETWLNADLEFIRVMDAMVLVPGWEKSLGTGREYDLAKTLAIPVFKWHDEYVGALDDETGKMKLEDWLNGSNR